VEGAESQNRREMRKNNEQNLNSGQKNLEKSKLRT